MKKTAYWIACFLFFMTVAFVAYKVIFLHYPLFPATNVKAWYFKVEARIKSDSDRMTLRVGVPRGDESLVVVEEQIASGSLDFSLVHEGQNKIGIWKGRTGNRAEQIGYSATITIPLKKNRKDFPFSLYPSPKKGTQEEMVLARRIVRRLDTFKNTDRLHNLVDQLRAGLLTSVLNEDDQLSWENYRLKNSNIDVLLLLLQEANLPAREVYQFPLKEMIAEKPGRLVEVWTGEKWSRIDPELMALIDDSQVFIPITAGGIAPVSISYGKIFDTRWSVSHQIVSEWSVHAERVKAQDSFLNRWSIFSLPLEFQDTFRIFLLVPIGALMICILRNIVGFPTFGVFMPVLMALAFRTTGLLYGLSIFAGIVLFGYGIRRSLERLRLLLVPRLSIILTMVILCFTVIALIGNHYGLRQLMAVGLLPFVILTMTIERFFVIVEESGPREGFVTALGSAAVAALTYRIVNFNALQLTFFIYPELLLTVAALQIVIGRYTGYRLFEISRFRVLKEKR